MSSISKINNSQLNDELIENVTLKDSNASFSKLLQ
jgi:hypothetical protein